MTQEQAFINGFIKAAGIKGVRPGMAWDLLRKHAVASGSFSLPSFSASPTQAPTTPLVDSIQPSKMFPVSSPMPSGGGFSPAAGSLGGTSSGSTGASQNFGYNINQTGLGGVNNSVTSAPAPSIGAALNKPVGMTGGLSA